MGPKRRIVTQRFQKIFRNNIDPSKLSIAELIYLIEKYEGKKTFSDEEVMDLKRLG